MNTQLKEKFHGAMLNIYHQAKSEADYNATRFLQMLGERDGVDVAKQLIPQMSEGFTALWEKRRLDLTVEAMIVSTPKFHALFTPEEIQECHTRLEQCGYKFPATIQAGEDTLTHRSRVGVIVIDCQTDDLQPAADFWKAALGVSGKVDDDGKYAVLADRQGYPKILLQSVSHESRVHLDIETDDQEAECARLEALGARRVDALKGWIVMEAPTGHRFCLVRPQGDDFPGDAAEWRR